MVATIKYRTKRLKRGLLARLALAFRRFEPLLATPAPLARREFLHHQGGKNLMIFLPGIGDLAEDFERQGFIHAMREQGVTADALALDAHYGYYARRMIHDRMAEDAILRAREAGYERIWLAGVSLGGFGAASYAARFPSHVHGLVLLAPYLGDAGLIREIRAAGGLKAWKPGSFAADDYPRVLWQWLKRYASQATPRPRIYLGYGADDRFAAANALLGEALPAGQVVAIPGKHDWDTWQRIWKLFLARRIVP